MVGKDRTHSSENNEIFKTDLKATGILHTFVNKFVQNLDTLLHQINHNSVIDKV